ncbi:MAG: tetratricopeptide repeat protein [Opitutus sp.]|nr:tetratricopeptide repeat protein [Opitutus sp.]
MFEQGDYADAAALLEMLVEFRPGQARTLYDLARARAMAGDRKRAIEALKQATAAGFADAPRAEAEPAFAKIKSDAAWPEILATVRANPPEPERRGGDGRGR